MVRFRTTMGQRCAKACSVITLVFAGAFFCTAIGPVASGVGSFAAMMDGGGYGTICSAQADEDYIATFNREVLETSLFADLRTNEDCSIVGFSIESDAQQSFSQLKEILEAHGWMLVADGSDIMGSFAKNDGQITWLFVMCTGFDTSTSVVVYTR